ncbi:MAG: NOG1 family protein [Methanobacterium formicicum]|jgi:nucleolar GTP-binding protein|uniref:NOG1 family protein n=1 Tax=Methanobacterium formicicum TaxID=2162 RepID=UPI0035313D69
MFLPNIPTPDEVLDKGFSRAKKAAAKVRTSKIHRQHKSKRIEEVRIQTACQVIRDTFEEILEKTPHIEELPMFYQDYIDVAVGVDDLKRCLGALNWANGVLEKLQNQYTHKVRRSPPESAAQVRKAAFGRIASVVNRIGDELDFLNYAKQKLRNIPTVDTEATTAVIAGFPNVGKSTLMRRITNAEPEVADYPFTTKGIQIGHFERRWQNYQIIDTPGLLDRPVEDMNQIELNAMVALEHLADLILFVFDPSQTSGFPVENQVNLYWEIRKIFRNTPVFPLFNKMDLADDEEKIKYIEQHITTEDKPLMVAASEGKGIAEIIAKLEEFNREEMRNRGD